MPPTLVAPLGYSEPASHGTGGRLPLALLCQEVALSHNLEKGPGATLCVVQE